MASNVDLRGQGSRFHYTSQISYLSENFGFASFPATGNYDFLIGNLPAGARVLRAYYVNGTAIATGTATIALGNVAGGAQYVAPATFGTLGLVSLTVVAASAAAFITADMTPVWARVVVSGAGLTALNADVILEFAVTHGPTGQN